MVMQQQRERQKRNLMDEYNRLKFLDKVGRNARNAYNNARNLYENRHNLTLGKPVQPNTLTSNASTNTIANYASPNMSATPTITNPATTNLATEFGGATTPTLSNATTGTTLANFGTQGSTALNGGALASSSPLSTAIASEASGAGMGLANTGMSALGAEAASTAGAGTLAGAGATTAGTGAALGGAGAAGAAGAGAGTAALGALGPVGAALAAGYMIYDMIAGAKKKKDYEAMQTDQKAMQQNEQLAQEGTNQAMQNLANDAQQNRQNANQGLVGDLYNSVTNPALKDMALNNLTNPQPVEQVPVKGSAASPVDNNSSLTNELLGDVTGNGAMNLGSAMPSFTQDDITSKLIQPGILNPSGDSYITPPSVSDAPQASFVNPPDIPEQPDVSIDEAPADNQSNSDLKGGLLKNVKSGLSNFMAGYKDNAEHGFLEGDLANGIKQDNGLGYRLGEVIGTGSRLMQNPYLQGAIAGIAYGKDKGDALYGLGKGWEWAQNRAKNNAYADALRKAGINVPNGVLGGIGANDAASLVKVQQAPYQNKYYNAKSRSENVKAGFLPNGKPVTVSDVIKANLTPEEYKEGTENGTIDPNQIVNLGVTQAYTTQKQANNKEKQLKNAESGVPTDYSYNVHESTGSTRKDVYNHYPDKNGKNGGKNGNSNGGYTPPPPKPKQPGESNPNALEYPSKPNIADKAFNFAKGVLTGTTKNGVNYTVVNKKKNKGK